MMVLLYLFFKVLVAVNVGWAIWFIWLLIKGE